MTAPNPNKHDKVDPMRERYEELAELAGSLAHEIKNPLSVIHMNIDLLSEDLTEMDSRLSRRLLNRIDIVRGQCERMESLLRDFLRYTRLRDIDLVSGNLNDQIDLVLRAYQAQAQQGSAAKTSPQDDASSASLIQAN